MFALANFLNTPIVIFAPEWQYDAIGEPIYQIHFSGIFLPLCVDQSPGERKYPICIAYDRDHFVALKGDAGMPIKILISQMKIQFTKSDIDPLKYIMQECNEATTDTTNMQNFDSDRSPAAAREASQMQRSTTDSLETKGSLCFLSNLFYFLFGSRSDFYFFSR